MVYITVLPGTFECPAAKNMEPYPHPIEGVIFDNDGLLMDTEGLYVIVHERLTGHKLDWDFRRRLMGLTGPAATTLIVKEYNMDETPEHYLARRDAELHKIFPTAKLFPGASELVDTIIKKNIPIALATSSNRANFNVKITHHGPFYAQFKSIICGDEVTNGKPSPELFLKSMKSLGISDPKNVLVFEDAPSGVKAANNAGMPVIMGPDPELPLELSLKEADAHPTYLFKSLPEVDLSLFTWKSSV